MSAKMVARVYGAIIGICIAIMALSAYSALANQTSLTAGSAANASASCSFAGAAAQTVAVTATTASTATATGVGSVRIICSQDSHFLQGVAGVTGVTALTGSSLLPANTVEYVQGNNSTFAFLRDAVSGTCYVTECK